jgi:hypothetical protein
MPRIIARYCMAGTTKASIEVSISKVYPRRSDGEKTMLILGV